MQGTRYSFRVFLQSADSKFGTVNVLAWKSFKLDYATLRVLKKNVELLLLLLLLRIFIRNKNCFC